jgi:hypothetical protein
VKPGTDEASDEARDWLASLEQGWSGWLKPKSNEKERESSACDRGQTDEVALGVQSV